MPHSFYRPPTKTWQNYKNISYWRCFCKWVLKSDSTVSSHAHFFLARTFLSRRNHWVVLRRSPRERGWKEGNKDSLHPLLHSLCLSCSAKWPRLGCQAVHGLLSLPAPQPGLLTTRTSSLTGCCSLSRLLQQNIIDQAACKQQKFIPVDLKSKSQGLTIPVFDETLLSYRWRSSCYSLHEQKVTGISSRSLL